MAAIVTVDGYAQLDVGLIGAIDDNDDDDVDGDDDDDDARSEVV